MEEIVKKIEALMMEAYNLKQTDADKKFQLIVSFSRPDESKDGKDARGLFMSADLEFIADFNNQLKEQVIGKFIGN